MSTPELDRLLRDGIAAIRAGDRETGRTLLEQIVETDPLHEQAWLWLSAAVESREERIICLQNVLTINPESKPARQGLEQLGVTPGPAPSSPPTPELPPLTRHSAPDAVDGDLYALVSGTPHRKEAAPDLPPEESWRAPLLDPDYEYESEATIARDRFGERAPQSLGALADVWVDLLILNPYGGLEDELKHGPVPHILVNIGLTAILQGLGLFVLYVMFVVLPSGRFTPPLVRSTVEFLAQANPDVEVIPASDTGSGMLLDALGIPRPEDVAVEAASSASTGIEQAIASVLAVPALLVGTYAILLFPGLLIEYLWYSLVAGVVCGMYGGKGSTIETMHAFTIALVPAAVVNIPFYAVLPFLSLGVALVALMMVGLYGLYISVLTFSTAQRYDRLGGAGMMIMCIVIANAVWGVIGFLLSLILS